MILIVIVLLPLDLMVGTNKGLYHIHSDGRECRVDGDVGTGH